MAPLVPDQDGEQFAAALQRLREERGLTQDDVAFAARAKAPGMTGSYVGKLERRKKRATAATIEAIAFAFGVDPTYFADYRLWLARRPYDPSAVGFTEALRNLQALDGGRKPSDSEPGEGTG